MNDPTPLPLATRQAAPERLSAGDGGSLPSSAEGLPTGLAPRRLSASALNRYRTCAKQFWFADIERAPTSREPSPQLAQANAIHHALERFYGLAPGLRSADTLERALRSVWTEHRKPGAFANRDEEAAYGVEAVTMLRRFAETTELGVVPLAREQWLTCRLENGVVLAGKLDRIDRLEGGLELIDYKTGRHQLDPDDLRRELAAAVYILLAEAACQLPVERVRYLYLRSGESVDWRPEREDVEGLRRELIALTGEIAAREKWPAAPGPHCRWCPFALRCPERQRVELDELVPVEELPF